MTYLQTEGIPFSAPSVIVVTKSMILTAVKGMDE